MTERESPIVLDELSSGFARRKVASGEFGSIGEVVEEAMRRYMAFDAKLEMLRAAIRKDHEGGTPRPFNFDEFLKEMRISYNGTA